MPGTLNHTWPSLSHPHKLRDLKTIRLDLVGNLLFWYSYIIV